MNYLALENISKSFGEKILFKDLSLFINKSDKVALVAKNGTGKTSLLRIVAGIEAPEAGGKIFIHKGIKVAFLDQDPSFEHGKRIFEVILDDNSPVALAIQRYEKAIEQPDNHKELEKAMEEMDAHSAWDYEERMKEVLTRLNITDWNQRVNSLSGGQRKRVALAKILIEEPDFLILDEPTNHLDLDMIEWLEEYLKRSNLTLFLVTHDRFFLENVCNVIMELDEGILFKYKGNYSYFLEKKAERELNEAANLDKAKSLFKKELEWVRRQPQARGTKAKARVDAFEVVKEKASKRLDEENVQLEINANRMGSKVIELYNVSKGYGDKNLIENFNYKFIRMERLGIVGVNGAGKSTLLRMILGDEKPDTGKVVIGDTIVFGYYSQDGLQLKGDRKVIDVVKDIAEFIPLTKGRKLTASQLLEKFLFPPYQQYNYVSTLSGGEKRRLFLLTILMKNPNFLILDEPTNDLDILTLNVLEDFLEDFPGCVLVVSHDRYFLDKIAEHLFVFEGDGKIKDFNGKYLEYRIAKKEEEQERKRATTEVVKTPTIVATVTDKLSYDERKELNKLEREIQKLEEKKDILSAEFNNFEQLTPEKIALLGKQIEEINTQIEDKEMRWLDLSEKA